MKMQTHTLAHKAPKTKPETKQEFSPDALRASLEMVGEAAAKSAYEKGRPVTFLRKIGGRPYMIKRFRDGSEVRWRVYLPTPSRP